MTEPSPEAPVVHLIDDDQPFRTALTRVLNAAGHEVRAYGSAADFLLARQRRLRGCLLLDVRMPGGPSGLELQLALTRQGETLPVIFLTGHGDIPMSVRAIKEGAFDFLTKPVETGSLLTVVGSALEREETAHRSSHRQREASACAAMLTPKETVVFRHLVEGRANKWIAAELGCSERTVKAHRARVMEKMQASSLVELVHVSELIGK